MIRLFEAFAGYGTSSFALKQLGIEYELVGFSEIDKYAIKCFYQNHCDTGSYTDEGYRIYEPSNFGDITKIDWTEVSDFDLLTGGFPCQAFSTAGKQLGEQDARGVLGLELTRALIEKQPKYFLFENVKGFMSKRFLETREKFVKSWEDAGYKVQFKVLNTKDFGIPQNRERVWFVGIRKDIQKDFKFPEPFELKLKLKDILEEKVDEKYFLKQEKVDKLFNSIKNKSLSRSQKNDISQNEVCNTLMSRDYKQPKCISLYRHSFEGFKGYDNISVSLKSSEGSGNQALVIDRTKCTCNEGKVCKVCCEVCGNYKDECTCKIELKELTKDVSQAMRVFDSDGVGCTLRGLGGGMGAKTGLYSILDLYNNKEHFDRSPSLTEPHHNSLRVREGMRVRRLTPKECFRLQGFLNDEVNLEGLSDTQAYKLAGNGQSVNVVKLILKELIK